MKINCRGPNLENMMNETAVHSLIRLVLLRRLQKSKLVRYYCGRAIFSSNGAIFSTIQRQVGPINQFSTSPWIGSYDLSNQWDRLRLWSRFVGWSSLFWPVTYLTAQAWVRVEEKKPGANHIIWRANSKF